MFVVPKKTENKNIPILLIIIGVGCMVLWFVFFRKGAIATPTVTIPPRPSATPSPTMTPTPTMTPYPTATPTMIPTPTPTSMPETAFESMFDEYSKKYSVDKNLLKKIAFCESGVSPGAQNGEYGGMFQFTASTWKATRNQMGQDENPDLRFGAKEAIETAAFKISRGGQDAWKNCL